MKEKILYPAFLTKEVAEKSVDATLLVVRDMHEILSRLMCSFVVLVPKMNYVPEDYPNHPVTPHLLYEYNLGDPKNWPHDFNNIARCKSLQLWHGRNDDRTDCMPHLLLSGDTPFWGGVSRHGIVVACSGFQPYFDKMFAGMIADLCVGLAYNEWAKIKPGFKEDFLPE